MEGLLASLGLDRERVRTVPWSVRSILLQTLLRHEAFDEALSCVETFLEERPDSASLLDARAQALLCLGRANEALDTVRKRLARGRAVSALELQGRCLLAVRDLNEARRASRELLAESPDGLTAWRLALDVALAAGEMGAAEQAAARLRALTSEDHRAYLEAMLEVSAARRDTVAASAYAVRLEQIAGDSPYYCIPLYRRLLAHYDATGQPHRAAQVRALLEERLAAERARLADALEGAPASRAARSQRERNETAPEPDAPAAPAPAWAPVAPPRVSPEERDALATAATELFGHPALLPGQAETMAPLLRGEDVLTLLPTGGGKSLCYQLPAFMDDAGATLVISPLIALMKDQVDSLPPKLAPLATMVNSSLDGDELRRRLAGIAAGRYRLVYAAPERLRQPAFLHALRCAPVRRFVVDEAHCVSLWGHDFRPDYLIVGRARAALGRPPLLAMTATAPPRVREDILRRLLAAGEDTPDAARPVLVEGEVTRPNLYFEVREVANQDEKRPAMLALCQAETGSGIVYVGSRARAEELAALLAAHGVSADHYHAGVGDPAERAARQDAFMSGRVRVVVATIAFGMGIDKPDIRFILHYDPSASLEAYYQEAGRAGRDGQPARCVLLYAPGDRGTLTRHANQDRVGVEDLRATYAAVRRRLGARRVGRVASGDLCRDLRREETQVRVALSLLEQSGQLYRHADAPRLLILRGLHRPAAGSPWMPLWEAAGLAVGRTVELTPEELVEGVAGLDLTNVEERLLEWTRSGEIAMHSAGRDLLLEVLPASADAPRRVQALLDTYTAVQVQRVEEVVSYARSRRCRHGHVRAYLSGRALGRCASCDNCAPEHPLRRWPAPDLPDTVEQLRRVLSALEEHGWGRLTLVRLLRADPALDGRGSSQAAWGALAFRSAAGVGELVDQLEAAGLLAARTLDHGGAVVELTAAGRRALREPARLEALAAGPRGRRRRGGQDGAEDSEPDAELFARLRAWRRQRAADEGVAPFVIAHDTLLRAVAAARPLDANALLAVKGMGEKRLAKIGQDLLDVVRQWAGEAEARPAEGGAGRR